MQTKEEAIKRAVKDLSQRLQTSEDKVTESSSEEFEFPNMSLGAPGDDEMSASMLVSGWKIFLSAENKTYEYRADKFQLRLFQFNNNNYLVWEA